MKSREFRPTGEYSHARPLVSELPDGLGGECEPLFVSALHSRGCLTTKDTPKKRRHCQRQCLLFFGGPEGSRTPVRKPLDITFSGCISLILFPLAVSQTNKPTASVAIFCMTRSMAKHGCTFTAQMTLSPRPRYSSEERVALCHSTAVRQPMQRFYR